MKYIYFGSIVNIDTVLFLSLIIVLNRNVESNRVKDREHIRKSARSNDNKDTTNYFSEMNRIEVLA